LYEYPNADWNTVANLKKEYPNVPIIAVINPNSGPGTAFDANFNNGINNLRAAGVIVLGYVYTNFGNRAISAVEGDINTYHGWYSLDGIFLDVMSWQSGYANYYSSVTAYAKSLGYTFVQGNPDYLGSSTAGYVGTVDNIVIYENSGLPSLSTLQSLSSISPDKSNFAYIANSITSLDTTFEKQSAQYVGWLYISSNPGNVYSGLPSYLAAEVAALA
jgi:hypothetical protein